MPWGYEAGIRPWVYAGLAVFECTTTTPRDAILLVPALFVSHSYNTFSRRLSVTTAARTTLDWNTGVASCQQITLLSHIPNNHAYCLFCPTMEVVRSCFESFLCTRPPSTCTLARPPFMPALSLYVLPRLLLHPFRASKPYPPSLFGGLSLVYAPFLDLCSPSLAAAASSADATPLNLRTLAIRAPSTDIPPLSPYALSQGPHLTPPLNLHPHAPTGHSLARPPLIPRLPRLPFQCSSSATTPSSTFKLSFLRLSPPPLPPPTRTVSVVVRRRLCILAPT